MGDELVEHEDIGLLRALPKLIAARDAMPLLSVCAEALRLAADALESCDGDEDGYKGPVQWFDQEKVKAAEASVGAALKALCGNDAEEDQRG